MRFIALQDRASDQAELCTFILQKTSNIPLQQCVTVLDMALQSVQAKHLSLGCQVVLVGTTGMPRRKSLTG